MKYKIRRATACSFRDPDVKGICPLTGTPLKPIGIATEVECKTGHDLVKQILKLAKVWC